MREITINRPLVSVSRRIETMSRIVRIEFEVFDCQMTEEVTEAIDAFLEGNSITINTAKIEDRPAKEEHKSDPNWGSW
jgi:hypothetical protein